MKTGIKKIISVLAAGLAISNIGMATAAPCPQISALFSGNSGSVSCSGPQVNRAGKASGTFRANDGTINVDLIRGKTAQAIAMNAVGNSLLNCRVSDIIPGAGRSTTATRVASQCSRMRQINLLVTAAP
ncbi:MAG TPA: hypothetical protein VJV79_20790 [Polyangiaceae bacterium]|nr:hypothetical protein [Polyangiaceae bacterium]